MWILRACSRCVLPRAFGAVACSWRLAARCVLVSRAFARGAPSPARLISRGLVVVLVELIVRVRARLVAHQLWPPAQRARSRFVLAPARDRGVVARQEHVGDRFAAIHARP